MPDDQLLFAAPLYVLTTFLKPNPALWVKGHIGMKRLLQSMLTATPAGLEKSASGRPGLLSVCSQDAQKALCKRTLTKQTSPEQVDFPVGK